MRTHPTRLAWLAIAATAGALLAAPPMSFGTTGGQGSAPSVVRQAAFPTQPSDIAFAPDGSMAYLLGGSFDPDTSVAVIDTSTDTQLRTITVDTRVRATSGQIVVGASRATSIAVVPSGAAAGLLLVSLADSRVVVVDPVSGTAVRRVGSANVNAQANGVTVLPDGSAAYVAEPGLDLIARIDLTSWQQTAVVQVPGYEAYDTDALLASPDSAHLYVPLPRSGFGDFNKLAVVAVATGTVVRTLDLTHGVAGGIGIPALSPDGSALYGASKTSYISGAEDLLRFDVATGAKSIVSSRTASGLDSSPTAVFPGGTVLTCGPRTGVTATVTNPITGVASDIAGAIGCTRLAVVGTSAYIVGFGGPNAITHIDGSTRSVIGLVDLLSSTDGSIAAAGNRLLVADSRLTALTSNGEVIGTTPPATSFYASAGYASPGSLVVASPDGQTAYVGAGNKGIHVVDSTTLQVRATIPIGPIPDSLAISPDGKILYVTADQTVYLVDTATATATNTVTLPDDGVLLEPSSDGGAVYAAAAGGKTIWRVDTSTRAITTMAILKREIKDLALTPSGTNLVAVTLYSEGLTLVDTTTGTVSSAPISVDGTFPVDVASTVVTDDDRAFVLGTPDGAELYVVDLAQRALVATVPVPDGIGDLALTDDGVIAVSNDGLDLISAPVGGWPTPIPTPTGPSPACLKATAQVTAAQTVVRRRIQGRADARRELRGARKSHRPAKIRRAAKAFARADAALDRGRNRLNEAKKIEKRQCD